MPASHIIDGFSVYIIPSGKRETMMHNGNLTDYFAKTTLTVK